MPETEVARTTQTTLIVYSDGLVEHRDRELGAGINALVEEVRQAPSADGSRETLRNARGRDDLTLHRRRGHAAGPHVGLADTGLTASIRLTGDHLAPAAARRVICATLTDWPVPHDTIDTAELCVSELVTNAVIHTGTAAELTARLEADVLTLLTAVPSSHMTRARDNLGDARPMA